MLVNMDWKRVFEERAVILNEWVANNHEEEHSSIIKWCAEQILKELGRKETNWDLVKEVFNIAKKVLSFEEDNPFRRGLPKEVRYSMNWLANRVEEAASEFYHHNSCMQFILRKRNKQAFKSGCEYAEYQAVLMIQRLRKMYKSGMWDGTIEGVKTMVVDSDD